MGLILDTSLLIADERGRLNLPKFLERFAQDRVAIASITSSELLHGVERAQDPGRKATRQRHVEYILQTIAVAPFGIAEARIHARTWAELTSQGRMIGPYDLLIGRQHFPGRIKWQP